MSPLSPHTIDQQPGYTNIPEPSPSLSADETSATETALETPLSVPDDVERVFGEASSLAVVESMSGDDEDAGKGGDTKVQPARQRTARASTAGQTNTHETTRRASWDLNIPEHAGQSRDVASDSGWRSSTRHETKPSM
jgi:hypothetical protein